LRAGINRIDWDRGENHQPIIGEGGEINVVATFKDSGTSTVGDDMSAAFTAMLDQIERTDNAN
jgi:hypothetical protein